MSFLHICSLLGMLLSLLCNEHWVAFGCEKTTPKYTWARCYLSILKIAQRKTFTWIWFAFFFMALFRISFPKKSSSHATYSISGILSLWSHSFQTWCVLSRQTHWSADHGQSYRHKWQVIRAWCCCVVDWKREIWSIYCVCDGGRLKRAKVIC